MHREGEKKREGNIAAGNLEVSVCVSVSKCLTFLVGYIERGGRMESITWFGFCSHAHCLQ